VRRDVVARALEILKANGWKMQEKFVLLDSPARIEAEKRGAG
jgi:hypothetical protein